MPPPPDEDPVRTGDILLGKYRVEHVVGRGGMGVVVAAQHLTLHERVAIKFLLPKCLDDEQLVQRFLREARAAVRIRSQHVARVTDVGTMENGAPYIVMEHLDGQNLAALLADGGRLAIPFAVEVVLQACEAVAEAHAHGIVHRDIKPSNLFLTHHADGSPCVKVLDFGISKMSTPDDHALTRTGGVLGSPLYMSPEQLRSSRDVDARADVYSMGVVLYELLTGRVPFMSEELPQLVYLIMNAAPTRPRAHRNELSEALENVLLTSIERDRDVRYASIADFAAALLPFTPPHARASIERIRGILPRDVLLAKGTIQGARSSSGVRVGGLGGLPSVTAKMDAPTPTPLDGGTLASFSPHGRTHAPAAERPSRRAGLVAAALGVLVILASAVVLRASSPKDDVAAAHAAPIEPAPRIEAVATALAIADAGAPAPGPSVAPTSPRLLPPSPKPTPAVTAAPKRPQPPAKDPFRRDVF